MFSEVRVILFFLQVYKSNITYGYNMLVGQRLGWGGEGWWKGVKGHRGRLCMIYIYLRNNLDMIFKNKLW